MRSKNRLYNLMFPPFILWLFPTVWIFVMPANFIIDSTVVLLALTFMHLPRIAIYKRTILKVWLFGFISDFIGSITCILMMVLLDSIDLHWSPFWSSVGDWSVVVVGIVISGICIYKLNLKITFKKLDIGLVHKKRLALTLAILTAPYLFLVPTNWLY